MCWLRLHYSFGISIATTIPEKRNKRVGREERIECWKKKGLNNLAFSSVSVLVNRRLYCTALKDSDVHHSSFSSYPPPPSYPVPCAPHVFEAIVSLKDFVIASHWNSLFKGILGLNVLFKENMDRGEHTEMDIVMK